MSESKKICKVSMCPPQQKTDIDYILDNSPLLNGEGSHFVIEFGSKETKNVVSAGKHIDYDDVIATMRGIKVKSKIKGTITESNNRYIIGEYDTNIDDYDLTGQSIKNSNSDLDDINELLEQNKNAIMFITNYIRRTKFPDFAGNTIDNFNVNALRSRSTTSEISEKYNEDCDSLDESYSDMFKELCSKENVKMYCENNALLSLKEQLDNLRELNINNIIGQYISTEKYGYSSGKISDFMLYPMYMEYITSDKFYYDDSNPYVVELFHHITEFMKIRSKIELNKSNINGLIAEFTQKCDETLKMFWSSDKKDYYGRMKEIFLYDFYTDDQNELISAKINDENRVTLFSKVLIYLQNLVKYQPPESAEKKYKDYDVNTIINIGKQMQTNSESSQDQLLIRLREIALMFVILRKIESDPSTSTDYYKEYMPDENLDDIFTLDPTLEAQLETLNSYSSNMVDPRIMSYTGPLKKYLGSLKSITDNESRILKSLCNKAIQWYFENHKDIDSGKIFDKFKEVTWPSPTTILKDDKKHDFFFIEEPKTNDELLKEVKENKNNNRFTEDSIETECGIDSYAYWIKYCTTATLVNTMLPMYWATGLITPIGPIPLPIIFIPMVVIPGRVTSVIGLGICGICPLPMIYFVNVGDIPGSIIPAMNMIVDMLKSLAGKLMSINNQSMKSMVSGLLKSNDEAINSVNEKLSQLNKDIYNLKNEVKEDLNIKKALRKKKKLDSTSHKRKNET